MACEPIHHEPMEFATCSAPTNIATIKYWGKEDEKLLTPLNDSISVTLSQQELHTVTTVASSSQFPRTRLWLNGRETQLTSRIEKVIEEMRKLAKEPEKWQSQHLHIVSKNSFPTAAGLASSASGLACLVACLAELFDVHERFDGQLSTIARQGSGSACRSLYGGIVRWQKGGKKPDASDSIAVQVVDEMHWPQLCAIICVVSDKQKDTSSTVGMQTSKHTSELLAFRAKEVVPKRIKAMEQACLARDFATFGKLTMQDSNQFHAVCLDTFPPISYLNDVSHEIMRLVHRLNDQWGEIRAAYTFDAGPNAVIFTQEKDVLQVLETLRAQFPTVNGTPWTITTSVPQDQLQTQQDFAVNSAQRTADGLQMVYVTRVGGGTRVLRKSDALINSETGQPLKLVTEQSQCQSPNVGCCQFLRCLNSFVCGCDGSSAGSCTNSWCLCALPLTAFVIGFGVASMLVATRLHPRS